MEKKSFHHLEPIQSAVVSQQKTQILMGFSNKYGRLGGSCYQQVNNNLNTKLPTPDLDNSTHFSNSFNLVQYLVNTNKILSCHDISDGGLLITILEMAFSGNKGVNINIDPDNENDMALRSNMSDIFNNINKSPEYFWFAEELGVVVELDSALISDEDFIELVKLYSGKAYYIGFTTSNLNINVRFNKQQLLDEPMIYLRYLWEETSFKLEKYQTNPITLSQEIELSKTCINNNYLIPHKLVTCLSQLKINNNLALECFLAAMTLSRSSSITTF